VQEGLLSDGTPLPACVTWLPEKFDKIENPYYGGDRYSLAGAVFIAALQGLGRHQL
jgi:hypothetical protein